MPRGLVSAQLPFRVGSLILWADISPGGEHDRGIVTRIWTAHHLDTSQSVMVFWESCMREEKWSAKWVTNNIFNKRFIVEVW